MNGNRIKFGQKLGTIITCPDMTNEEGFKKKAEMVDNYAIQGENLMLTKAWMAPTVRV